MLLDFGAEVNAIYRTPSNVILTPLDICIQKGHRNTAKFIQSNDGLPAQRLKITAKRPSVSAGSTDSDQLIKPGKFIEKEEVYDIKKSKKYVVYVKRSDSISDDEHFRGRLKARSCGHHKRRTKSCSGLHQRKPKCCRGSKKFNLRDKNSESSDELSSDLDETCCSDCCLSDESNISHTKSHQIVCEYKKKRKKKKEKCSKHLEPKPSGDSDTDLDKTDKRKGKREPIAALKGCSHDEETNKTNSDTQSTTKKRPQSAKSSTLPKRKAKATEGDEKPKEINTKSSVGETKIKEVTFADNLKKSEEKLNLDYADTTNLNTVEEKSQETIPTIKQEKINEAELKSSFVMLQTNNDSKENVYQDISEISLSKEKGSVKSESKLTVNINIKEVDTSLDQPKKEEKLVVVPLADTRDVVNPTEKPTKEIRESKQVRQSFKVIDEESNIDKTLKNKVEPQNSKEEDSGFEPSPRSLRQSRKNYNSANAYSEKNPYASKPFNPKSYSFTHDGDKRKPGDKNAVNMKTVTKSIQKNMKR